MSSEEKQRRATAQKQRYDALRADPVLWAAFLARKRILSGKDKNRAAKAARGKRHHADLRADPERWKTHCAKKVKQRAKNLPILAAKMRIRRTNNRPAVALISAKARAKKLGVDFDLDLEWFAVRLENGRCEISNIAFVAEKGRVGPYTASLDRIDASGPYTKRNCRMILWCLNLAFNKYGEQLIFDVFRAVFALRGEGLP